MADIEKLKTEIASTLKDIDYKLISLGVSKEKDGLYLRITVDRIKPIDLDAISKVSALISKKLDEIDPFSGAYFLDVSSLGAEKPIALEELQDYVGSYVNVHLSNPFKGLNIIEGTLDIVEEEKVAITYKEKTRSIHAEIKRCEIDKARLAIKF